MADFFTGMGAGLVSGLAGLFGGDAANKANAEMAQKQMDFQERMRSTQYQTTVKDLEAAGLNPMLAYTNGGAGTPMGAMATMQNVAGPAVKDAIHSASTAALAKADVELKDQQTTNVVADTTQKEANAQYTDALAKRTSAETSAILLRMPQIDIETKNMIRRGLQLEAETSASNALAALHSANRVNTDTRTDILRSGDLPEAQSKGRYYESVPYNPFMLRDLNQTSNSAAHIVNSMKPVPQYKGKK